MARALSTPETAMVHTIARIHGADGGELAIGTDCDGVTIRADCRVVLDHAAREDFARAYFEAVRQAEAWAQRYPEATMPP